MSAWYLQMALSCLKSACGLSFTQWVRAQPATLPTIKNKRPTNAVLIAMPDSPIIRLSSQHDMVDLARATSLSVSQTQEIAVRCPQLV